MPRGGKRDRAGRPAALTATQRAEIKREYARRAAAWVASVEYWRNPVVKENLQLGRKIADKISRHGGPFPTEEELERIDPLELIERIPPQDFDGLIDALESAKVPNLRKIRLDKRGSGVRQRFIKELAQEYGVKPRTITSCLNSKV
jgi:hypothetical protein